MSKTITIMRRIIKKKINNNNSKLFHLEKILTSKKKQTKIKIKYIEAYSNVRVD